MSDFDFDCEPHELRHRVASFVDRHLAHFGPNGRSDWFKFLGKSGLATPRWPQELGGLGFDEERAALVATVLAGRGAGRPIDDFIGLTLVAPTLLKWGSAAQKARYLPGIRTGEQRWCQLFSEPEAGSDLASVRARAERTTDSTWTVSGQKVWSSFAHKADFAILLARTGTQESRHRGLTYFVLDMASNGVSTRPLMQITGDSEFNEVFLDSVTVTDGDIVGSEGGGWPVAMTTLGQERSGLTGTPRVQPGEADKLVQRAVATGRWTDPVVRDRLMDLHVLEQVHLMNSVRAEGGQVHASMLKLFHSELNEKMGRFAPELETGGALSWNDEVPLAAVQFLRTKYLTIPGGTSEIQRNIIAERVYGLPKDYRP
ncbi:hypothetical protein CH300_16950 [Rhodococcus sp. 15-1154-1]|nr:acyl-CoA dehydrogenase family protein [Rhodococcus sp. 15-1154-1]OZF02526.1 hypothetical protein CH300_16950 [Rhodococcus sp. 15-1154-1]